MHLHVCGECQRTYASVGDEPWCPHCGSRTTENTPSDPDTSSDPEPDYLHPSDERDETRAETGGWLRIILTLLLILAFYLVFAGDDGLDLIRSWYNQADLSQ